METEQKAVEKWTGKPSMRRLAMVWCERLPSLGQLARPAALLATCAVALSTAAWQLADQSPDTNASQPDTALQSSQTIQLSALARRLEETLDASRPVLLGSRDPDGPSCVNIIREGEVKNEVPGNVGDFDGGPGTSMGMLYYYDRRANKTPMADFQWHQNRLRTYLENQVSVNQKVLDQAHRFAEETRTFSEAVESWTALPAELKPIGFDRKSDWPGFCLAKLDNAIRSRDLNETRRWSAELAAAAFAIEDLHRWLLFLCENQLVALDFQKRSESLFSTVEALKTPYDPQGTISQFPAGVLCLNGISNYYEIERQAERIFATPVEPPVVTSKQTNITSGSVWVMYELREVFLDMQSVLSPANRVTWALAARSPFHHSYMVNMLFRSTKAKTVSDMRAALKKFDSIKPNATVGELMGALAYRGHSFAGLEWGDRFRDELVAAANEIGLTKSDEDAFMQAAQWTHKFYKPENYGSTLTLRDAIENQKLDCVRATDMIAAIHRNAGRTRFAHVRWSSETMGHSVAAYLGTDETNKPYTLVVDALDPTDEPEIWPDAYFNGHEWPANLRNNPTPYSVELYGRGIDSYIWVEGYIIRGPNAGHLVSAGVPYFPSRTEGSTRKVYDGPYPR